MDSWEDMHVDLQAWIAEDAVIPVVFAVEIEALSMFAEEVRISLNVTRGMVRWRWR